MPRLPANPSPLYIRVASAVLVAAAALVAPHARAADATNDLSGLALDPGFITRIQDREQIDRSLTLLHPIGAARPPAAQPPVVTRRAPAGTWRVVRRPSDTNAPLPHPGETTTLRVPRGYRAPTQGRPQPQALAAGEVRTTTDAEREAARWIEDHLADDGLLVTTAQVLARLQREATAATSEPPPERLARLGLPVDWLEFFVPPAEAGPDPGRGQRAAHWIAHLDDQLRQGKSADALRSQLTRATFQFTPTEPAYAAAVESGQVTVGLLRLQLGGGGWREGIVQGGILHAHWQLADTFPAADYMISVPEEFADPVAAMAATGWRLRRKDQLLLLAEPLRLSAWAQDNGKAGVLREAPGRPARLATLAPRYASQGDGRSLLESADTAAFAGWIAAGHAVVPSPLLFQGGNLMPIQPPGGAPGSRLLLVGEGEIARNVVLGLTADQARDALRLELGADAIAVVPSVSFHIDFDVSIRTHQGAAVALVNDPPAAAKTIAVLCLEPLRRLGTITGEQQAAAQAHLDAGRTREFLAALTNAFPSLTGGSREYPSAFSEAFAPHPIDDPRANLQIVLVALDYLESTLPADERLSREVRRGGYLDALRRLEAARVAQQDTFRALGLRVVPVPSMPDLSRSVNYVNGLQHDGGFVVPVFDGFLAPLDRAALGVLRDALGPTVRIQPIRSGNCQRLHGGIHCAASVYPRLEAAPAAPAPGNVSPSP